MKALNKLGMLAAVAMLLDGAAIAQDNPVAQPEGREVAKVRKKNKSISASGQITVYGDAVRLNKAVNGVGEKLLKDLYEFMDTPAPKDGFYPINIILYNKGISKKGRDYVASVIPVEGRKGYQIRLVVDIRNGIDKRVLEQGIMEALVLELTMRTNPEINKQTRVRVPAWLRDGLLGALEWNNGNQERGIFVILKESPDLFPVARLFATSENDISALGVTSKGLFRSSATAMVMALQRQPEGKSSLRKMLSEVAVFEGETVELLRRNFSAMNVGKRGLQKLWNLQLAEMSVAKLSDVLTIQQTETRLAKLLFFRFRDDDGRVRSVKLDDFDVLMSLEGAERVRITNRLSQDLRQLSFRSYPDYRPILAGYSAVVQQLGLGKFEGVKPHLETLAAGRKQSLETGIRVRDVLDWYQISKARNLKGDFSGYRNLIKRMQDEKEETRDRIISPYLDAMEKLMQR